MPDSLFYNFGNGNTAIITIARTEIECPTCQAKQDISKHLEAKRQPANGCYRLRCLGCRRWLGATTACTGDAVCWDEEEAKAAEARRLTGPPPTPEQIAAFEAMLQEMAAGPSPEEEARKWLAEYDRTRQMHQNAHQPAMPTPYKPMPLPFTQEPTRPVTRPPKRKATYTPPGRPATKQS